MAWQPPLTSYAAILRRGGVIAYPTEGVYGLGCLASAETAVARIIRIKGRFADKGLILIASHPSQLKGWADIADPDALLARSRGRIRTWVVSAGPRASALITGGRDTVAVRITEHPVAAALCDLAGEPLVSTSANRSGRPPITKATVLRRVFVDMVDAIVPGPLGGHSGPSEIVDFQSGRILRPAPR